MTRLIPLGKKRDRCAVMETAFAAALQWHLLGVGYLEGLPS